MELKNTRLDEDAKVPHLSYFGDAEVGAGTNIGAGSITANFDHRPGVPKKRTVIGRERAGRRRHDVRRAGHGRRRRLDGGRYRRHRGCPGQRSRRVPAEADDQGGSRWKAGRLSRRLPGLGAPDVPAPGPVVGRAIGLTPNKRLMLVSGRSNPELAQKIGAADRLRARRDDAEDLRERRDVLPLRGLDPRRGHLHRADGVDAGRPASDGASDHDQRGQARLGEAHHGRDPVVLLRPPGQEVAGRASRSRRSSSPTSSRPQAPTAC